MNQQLFQKYTDLLIVLKPKAEKLRISTDSTDAFQTGSENLLNSSWLFLLFFDRKTKKF